VAWQLRSPRLRSADGVYLYRVTTTLQTGSTVAVKLGKVVIQNGKIIGGTTRASTTQMRSANGARSPIPPSHIAAFSGNAPTLIPQSAQPNTKLDALQDCGVPCVEALDNAGPTGFGFFNYNVDANGDLRVVVSLKNAVPNTTYEIFLVCGPTHASACGFISIGFLTTNGQGNGNSGAIDIPLATLQALPFGSGTRNDHIDLLKGVGDLSGGLYTNSGATSVSYLVP